MFSEGVDTVPRCPVPWQACSVKRIPASDPRARIRSNHSDCSGTENQRPPQRGTGTAEVSETHHLPRLPPPSTTNQSPAGTNHHQNRACPRRPDPSSSQPGRENSRGLPTRPASMPKLRSGARNLPVPTHPQRDRNPMHGLHRQNSRPNPPDPHTETQADTNPATSPPRTHRSNPPLQPASRHTIAPHRNRKERGGWIRTDAAKVVGRAKPGVATNKAKAPPTQDHNKTTKTLTKQGCSRKGNLQSCKKTRQPVLHSHNPKTK